MPGAGDARPISVPAEALAPQPHPQPRQRGLAVGSVGVGEHEDQATGTVPPQAVGVAHRAAHDRGDAVRARRRRCPRARPSPRASAAGAVAARPRAHRASERPAPSGSGGPIADRRRPERGCRGDPGVGAASSWSGDRHGSPYPAGRGRVGRLAVPVGARGGRVPREDGLDRGVLVGRERRAGEGRVARRPARGSARPRSPRSPRAGAAPTPPPARPRRRGGPPRARSPRSSSTTRILSGKASSANSSLVARQSSGANVVSVVIFPVSSPWASGP